MLKCLLKLSLVTPLIHLEDVYLTGILAEKCGFRLKNLPGFFTIRIDPCENRSNLFVLHYIEAEEQQKLLEMTSTNETKCEWV